ncbi:lytic transglycosylase domain-containing protein [Thiospirillum jenense]|uniref:Transglycosylase SLT domain-containing protein n=1 Tax=Thiospirillum jenense TaxID=1653858 RepID=A0A839HE27_9GAMM|nr:transglycosylase SLT domain-containing protein [Thiospirillum jenense]MBB1127133.1 transglycosylase SLT domain-containing protein [Thiospirillum jenense]
MQHHFIWFLTGLLASWSIVINNPVVAAEARGLPIALWRQAPPSYKISPPVRQPSRSNDIETTLLTYCRAAARGQASAYYELGWLYFSGHGVARHPERAAGWLTRAAAAGDHQAKHLLKLLVGIQPQADTTCERLLYPPPLPTIPRITAAPERVVQIETLVRTFAPHFNLHPELVMAVIAIESNFNPRAESPAGAQGLMQLMPATAARFGVTDVWDAKSNLIGGMMYLSWLLRRYHGAIELALAAYNAGEGAVDQYAGIPPYTETRNYVARITRQFNQVTGGASALIKPGRAPSPLQ